MGKGENKREKEVMWKRERGQERMIRGMERGSVSWWRKRRRERRGRVGR